MAFFGLNSANSVNTLFSSLNSGSSGIGSGNFLADYASIRNGGYYKLLKAYYGTHSNRQGLSSVSQTMRPSTSTSVSKDSTKKLTKIENSADDLKKSADALLTRGNKNVFRKVDVKQADGTVKKDYDVNAIYDKVKSFVDDYNALINNAEDTNTSTIDRAVRQLTHLTDTNEKTLDKIGISIAEDDTLRLDKETFMKADMDVVKGLFNGNGSYGYSVSTKASMVDYYAQNEASKANTYGRNGAYNYNYSYGSNYNSYF